MKSIFYLIRKYWAKHIKNAAVLMFAGVLLTAVIVVSLMQVRATFNCTLHSWYDSESMADLYLPNVSDEFVDKITSGKSGYDTGYIYVLGKDGIGDNQYTYGYIDDPYKLAHIPMSTGRLPENQDEIAIDQGVLDLLRWAGNIGDTITLNSGTYTVVGIIDEIYGKHRYSASEITMDALDGDIPPYPIPLIYVGKTQQTDAAYRITMLNGLIKSEAEGSAYTDIIYEEYGDDGRWCLVQIKSLIAADVSHDDEFRFDVRWLLILALIACAIAVLSVFSVLRMIFADRKNNIAMLKKIGMSERKITLMYMLECAVFTVVQTVFGALLGVGAYCIIYKYQVDILNMPEYSAFTNDVLVTGNTFNPFVVACMFSLTIMIAAYSIMGISSLKVPQRCITKKKSKSLHSNIRCIFRQRTVGIIQTISLTLICTGVLLGYTYYTDNGKEYLDLLKFDFPESYEIGNGFDLEKDGIAEYYASAKPSFTGTQAFSTGNDKFVTADSNYSLGIDDEIANKFENIVAAGELEQTFIVTEEPNEQYKNAVAFSHEDEKQFIIDFSKDEYKNFFEQGELGAKNLYRTSTKLADENTINRLEQYVTQGEISFDKLNCGEEILLISRTQSTPFKAGDKLTIGSVASNGGYGIGDILLKEITIGAVVTLPRNADKFLLYAFQTDDIYNFATTADGANAIGLHNASYTEIFAFEGIDGGLIDASAGMKLT